MSDYCIGEYKLSISNFQEGEVVRKRRKGC